MANSLSSSFERVMACLPGWLMIFAGAAMVSMVCLIPSWIECRKLDWQLQVVQKQSHQLVQQQIAYEQFLLALREKDPVVVERMAYYHLRLKPVNLSLIDQANHALADEHPQPAHRVWQTLPTIEDLLAQPIFKPSHACPPGVIPETRMVRVATGPHRYLLLGFGVVCLFFGVLPPSRETLAALSAVGEDSAALVEEDTASVAVLDEPEPMPADIAIVPAVALAPAAMLATQVDAAPVEQEPLVQAELVDEDEGDEEDDDTFILAEVDSPDDDTPDDAQPA